MGVDAMIEQLRELRQAARDAYTDDFPGSARWHRMTEREQEVAVFEAAHPEVVAEVNRRQVEARNARLAGRDIMGM
jgi:hypothetical protein